MTLYPNLDEYVTGLVQALERHRWDEAAAAVQVLFDLVTILMDHMDHLAHAAINSAGERRDPSLAFREELEALYSAYTRVFEAAMRPGLDRSVLGSVLYVPWGVAQRALRRNHASLVRRFLSGGRQGLTQPVRKLDLDGQVLARDRLTRFPKEFLRFGLKRALEEGNERELETAVLVARDVLGYLAELAKRAFDQGDHELFAEVAEAMNSVPTIDSCAHWSRGRDADPARVRAAQRLLVSKNTVTLGVAGWIIRSCREGASEDVEKWLDTLAPVVSCRHLVLGFEDAHSFETQDAMGWDWWLLEGRDGEVVRIDMGSLVDLAFLEFLSRCDRPELLWPEEPSAVRQLQHHFGEDRLEQTLRDGLEGGIFSTILIEAQEVLLQQLQQIRGELEESWSAIVLESPVAQARVQRFLDHVVTGWESGGGLRGIFASYGRLVEREEDEDSYVRGEWRGVNTLLDKEYFVEGSAVVTDYFAEQYGESIARGQDSKAWQFLTSAVASIPVNSDRLVTEVRDHLKPLPESFLIIGNWPDAITALRQSTDFQFALDAPWEGDFSGHKVFHSWADRSSEPAAIVFTLDTLPTWIQWSPWLLGGMQRLHRTLKGRLRQIDDQVAATLRFSGERPEAELLSRRMHFEAYGRSTLEQQDGLWVVLHPEPMEDLE